MKLLVTGGAGFIGSNFVHYWVKKHPRDKITVLDKLTYAGDLDNLEGVIDKITFIKGDICDRQVVEKAMRGAEVVVHFAAESHNTRAEKQPEIFYRTNVQGTEMLLDAAQKLGVKKFIHISTDEVYGSIKKGYFKETDADRCLQHLKADYPKSKAQGDKLARQYAQKGLPVIVLRPTNNFGPCQHPEKALPRWITNLLLGQKIPVWGKGEQVRDWLYVKDTCLTVDILVRKGKVGDVYNVGANHQPEITNRQMAEWLVSLMKLSKSMLEFIPDPRPAHDFRYGVDTAKIKKLGFKPQADVKKTVSQTIAWYQQNKKWWQKRKREAERIYRKLI